MKIRQTTDRRGIIAALLAGLPAAALAPQLPVAGLRDADVVLRGSWVLRADDA